MVDTIYIEESVLEHSRTIEICSRFPKASKIVCERYGEVFNPKSQNFRLQKRRPALILAEKYKNFVLEAPPGYGIGARQNYYFSHMLNCVYDCRYCFLQGMYRSANYVVFVNFEDFTREIKQIISSNPKILIHFFSGYDCDSLAFEPMTGFAQFIIPFFRDNQNVCLELRTKSTQVKTLLRSEAIPNCIVAFSFTPEEISKALEHKVPSVEKRIKAMLQLQQSGWNVGLRFDPLIYQLNCQEQYSRLFETVFKELDIDLLHSVSLGSFRLPEKFYNKIRTLYPKEKLFSTMMEQEKGMVSYKSSLRNELTEYCTRQLLRYVPTDKFFPCTD